MYEPPIFLNSPRSLLPKITYPRTQVVRLTWASHPLPYRLPRRHVDASGEDVSAVHGVFLRIHSGDPRPCDLVHPHSRRWWPVFRE